MPRDAMPWHAMPCHAMPCHAMPCHAMPSHRVASRGIAWHHMASHGFLRPYLIRRTRVNKLSVCSLNTKLSTWYEFIIQFSYWLMYAVVCALYNFNWWFYGACIWQRQLVTSACQSAFQTCTEMTKLRKIIACWSALLMNCWLFV